MVDFTQTVQWSDLQDLENNLLYGLGLPTLFNLTSISEGLAVGTQSCFGRANYSYDFGRSGTVTEFRFDGVPHLKFRLKVADTVGELSFADFDGTDIDTFSGTVIDTAKYLVDPQAYSVSQSNAIYILGEQTDPTDVFIAPGKLTSQFTMSDTYSVSTTMRLSVDTNEIQHSGSFAFLELDNGINNVQMQKYHAQIRSKIVDAAGNTLGQDVDSNDIILGEPVDIEVDGSIVDSTVDLTNGIFGTIEDEIGDTTAVDEFSELKIVDEVVDFVGRESLSENCVRILGIRADYSLTGILADLEQGLYYRPKRINGYYAMRMPVTGTHADTFANRILSLNFDSASGEYVYAEVNDEWKATVSVPAGEHYYYFLVDGTRVLDVQNPDSTTIASGEASVLTVTSTQFVEFTYNGRADEVLLVGTFNNFVGEKMEVGFDSTEVLKIGLDGEAYHNGHDDWHKIEIEFDSPLPIIGIRFITEIPFNNKQRVRILLDDAPITRDEWRITCGPEQVDDSGISECATYSNLLNGNFDGSCLSYFINNTDVITASEDDVVEWQFIQDEPINDRELKLYRKFAFLSRLDNHVLHDRSHKSIEILLPADFVSKVTDFIVSDNEVPFRPHRRSVTGSNGEWSIVQAVLQDRNNVITPTQELDAAQTYGGAITATKDSVLSFIETLNQSGIALNNTEIACTLATNLTQELGEVLEVVDLGVSPDPYGPPPDQRFTRESFTRASDRLRVVVINIDIEPLGTYYLHLVAQPADFLLEVYATEDDARNRTNRLGYTQSAGYGFQEISTFTADNPLVTPTGLVYIEADNIIVCFDENAANTIFRTSPRANI